MAKTKTSTPKIVIDGYNLICALGILPGLGGRSVLPEGKLEEARNKLLHLLVNDLSDAQRHRTTVVFDALEPPERLPNSFTHKGIRVVFSRGYETADELIIEKILAQTSGTDWVIVSSDHRIQNAASRRHMTFCDSAEWYYDGTPGRPTTFKNEEEPEEEKPGVTTKEEMDFWLNFFGEE